MENKNAVIFDMDGVIIFSENAHIEAFKKVLFDSFNLELNQNEYDSYFLGKTDKQGFIDFLENKQITRFDLEYLLNLKTQEYISLYPANVVGNKNILTLINELYEIGVPLAITTSSSREELNMTLNIFHLNEKIPLTVAGDEIVHGKPNPEPYNKTVEKLNIKASRCIVIEDSISGIKSAKAAGCTCIGITTTHPKTELKLADYIFSEVSISDIENIFIANNLK